MRKLVVRTMMDDASVGLFPMALMGFGVCYGVLGRLGGKHRGVGWSRLWVAYCSMVQCRSICRSDPFAGATSYYT
jgi:hypothetical protein